MLDGEYLIIKPGYLKEYATKRFNAQKNVDGVDFQDFSANRFDSALVASQDIYGFDGVNATIRIEGPLSVEGPDIWDLYDGVGGCSYLNIDDAISRAASDVNPEQGEVFVKMNTPGGTVRGCDATFQAMWKLSQTHKITVENMGLIASGGVWLSSAAHEIIAKTPVALQGSIGVVLNVYDFTGMLESVGIEQIIITNFESPDKVPDLKTEKGISVVREELDAIYNVFRQRVLQGRDRALGKGVMSIEDVNAMTGRVFIAEKSLELGLLDSLEDSSTAGSDSGAGKEANKSKKTIEKKDNKNEINKSKGGKSMDLNELLDANPAAKTQYTEAIANARAEGVQSIRAVVERAAPVLASEDYPKATKDLALECVKGVVGIDALTANVASWDAMKEMDAAKKAKEEIDKTPETTPEGKTGAESKGGKVETAEDYSGAVSGLKGLQGMPSESAGGTS